MQFTTVVLSAISATGAFALHPRALTTGSWSNSTATTTAWVTQTVTAYETYCPKKTTWTHTNGGKTKTYTGTKKQWVTVTDCAPACTISNKVGHKPSVVPVGYNPKYQNGTVPATTTAVPAPVYTPCPCSSSSATVIIIINNNGTSYGTAYPSGSAGSTGVAQGPASTKGSNSPASTLSGSAPASTGEVCQCPVPNKNSGNTGSSNSGNTGSGSSNSGNTGNTGSSNSGNTGSGSGSSGNGTVPVQSANGAGKAVVGQAVTGLVGLAFAAFLL